MICSMSIQYCLELLDRFVFVVFIVRISYVSSSWNLFLTLVRLQMSVWSSRAIIRRPWPHHDRFSSSFHHSSNLPALISLHLNAFGALRAMPSMKHWLLGKQFSFLLGFRLVYLSILLHDSPLNIWYPLVRSSWHLRCRLHLRLRPSVMTYIEIGNILMSMLNQDAWLIGFLVIVIAV